MHQSKNQYITEYGALNFALEINKDDKNYIEEAYGSISMGSGQILGANYMYLGYTSAKEMYDKFSLNEEEQIRGMINFIKNFKKGSLLDALKIMFLLVKYIMVQHYMVWQTILVLIKIQIRRKNL
jgi:hypothetical protein